jgi:hypothetical protein
MKLQILGLLLLALAAVPIRGAEKNKKIPVELDAVLSAAPKAILYSLEPITEPNPPGPKLHGFKILGRTNLDQKQTVAAVNAFKVAISDCGRASVACFDPRHALRLTKDGQTYDLLLCYACQNLYVYRGDKLFTSFCARGSPKTLNELLTAAKIPLSTSH